MIFGAHGGGCCGRRHIYGMNGETSESIRRLIAAEGYGPNTDTNKVIEIVLSEENRNLEDLRAEVESAGFTLVATWDNIDSGSQCYMYLSGNDVTYFPGGVPANQQVVERIVNHAPQRVVVAPPRRVIHSTFHNVLRGGRSEAGWPTLEAARAAAPRARSVDRRDIYNDGSVEYANL